MPEEFKLLNEECERIVIYRLDDNGVRMYPVLAIKSNGNIDIAKSNQNYCYSIKFKEHKEEEKC